MRFVFTLDGISGDVNFPTPVDMVTWLADVQNRELTIKEVYFGEQRIHDGVDILFLALGGGGLQ
jgi:hypothetical protein